MPSCAFNKCTNHSRNLNKTHGITFHSFPQDEILCYKWLRVLRKQRREPEWTPTSHSRVCSLHFKPEDIYATKKDRKMISKGAVPSYQVIKPTKPKPSRRTPDSNSSDTDSDSKEEAQNTFLLRKIEKVIADKKRLLQVNVNLKKQNKRLSRKCKSLKDIVVRLMDQIGELESSVIETREPE